MNTKERIRERVEKNIFWIFNTLPNFFRKIFFWWKK